MIIGLINDTGKVRNILRDMNFYHILSSSEIQDGENHLVELTSENIADFQGREDFLIVRIGPARNEFEGKAKAVILPAGNIREKVEKLVADHLYRLQDSRPNWDQYFMNIAEQVKMRCTCLSAKKGTVIVKDKMIISSGYNGTPKGIEHCVSGGCQRCTSRHLGKLKSGSYSEPCICCHSEENAIVQAAYHGTSTKGAALYTTFTPCTMCAKMIINAGIKEVFAKVNYPDEVGRRLFKEAGVALRII